MVVIKLCIIFSVIITLIILKLKLWVAMLGGIVATALLFQLPIADCARLFWNATASWETISLLLITWFVFFLQRMMDRRNQLRKAQQDLAGIFNNRRINTMLAPVLIGLLPSAAVVVICGDIVRESTQGYLDKDEQSFVTSYYRHISESCLPTYSTIIIMSTLSGVAVSSFVVGMIPMVAILLLLGYVFYVRKIPRETGRPSGGHPLKSLGSLVCHLWTLIVIIILIMTTPMGTLWSIALVTLLAIPVYRFPIKEIPAVMKSAVDIPLLVSTWLIMVLKEFFSFAGIIQAIPETFSRLPIPVFLSFALVFFIGTVVAGSTAIVATCTMAAFAAIPGSGMPLMVLLMSFSYAAMQLSPTHVCLTITVEHFGSSFIGLVKKTILPILLFCVIVVGYYLLLTGM